MFIWSACPRDREVIAMEREMPDKSVVVNLNQFERSRRAQISAEALGILHRSRDLLIDGAARALTRQTEAMENALLAIPVRCWCGGSRR